MVKSKLDLVLSGSLRVGQQWPNKRSGPLGPKLCLKEVNSSHPGCLNFLSKRCVDAVRNSAKHFVHLGVDGLKLSDGALLCKYVTEFLLSLFGHVRHGNPCTHEDLFFQLLWNLEFLEALSYNLLHLKGRLALLETLL